LWLILPLNTFHTILMYFKAKKEDISNLCYLVSAYFHIIVSWPDGEPSSESKKFAI
jgi:hypothetical protein